MKFPQTLFYVPCQYTAILFITTVILAGIAPTANGEVLVTADDSFGIPYRQTFVGDPFIAEDFGVLDNDTIDGEPAGESGVVTVELVDSVARGMLSCPDTQLEGLCSNGSFAYEPDLDQIDPGLDFNGIDIFTYRATSGTVVSEVTTVTLTACKGGPDIFTCWKQHSYLAKLTELGYIGIQEGFENDTVWGSVRSPPPPDPLNTAPSIVSMGIQWQTNHPETNEITTGAGPAREPSLWGVYDPSHGFATGTLAYCKTFNDPPPDCLLHDGFTGVREAGQSVLHAAGGFFTGAGANITVILDKNPPITIGLGKLFDTGHQFFGVIDAGVTGFTRFEFQEIDGKVEQRVFIFGDDFTFAVPFGLEHALTALQVMTGIQPGLRLSLGADVNNDGRIGMSEAISILREVAGLP